MADEFEEGLKDLVSEQFKDGEVAPLRNETTGRFIGEDGKDIVEETEDSDDVEEAADERVNENEPEGGAADEDAEDEDEDEDEEGDEDEPKEGDEDEPAEDKKPKSRAQKRFDALTATVKRLERTLDEERNARTAAAAVPKKADGTPFASADEYAKDKFAKDEKAPKKPDLNAKGADGKPLYALGEFDAAYKDDYDDFLDARREFMAAAKAEFTKGASSASATAAPSEMTDEFRTQIDTTVANGKKLFKDFDDVVVKGIANNAFPLSEAGARYMADSDVGAEMVYALAKDTKLAQDIAKLKPMQQLKRFVNLESKIYAEKAAKEKKAKGGSAAPTPIAKVRGGGAREGGRYDSENFDAVESNWNADQKKGGRR